MVTSFITTPSFTFESVTVSACAFVMLVRLIVIVSPLALADWTLPLPEVIAALVNVTGSANRTTI